MNGDAPSPVYCPELETLANCTTAMDTLNVLIPYAGFGSAATYVGCVVPYGKNGTELSTFGFNPLAGQGGGTDPSVAASNVAIAMNVLMPNGTAPFTSFPSDNGAGALCFDFAADCEAALPVLNWLMDPPPPPPPPAPVTAKFAQCLDPRCPYGNTSDAANCIATLPSGTTLAFCAATTTEADCNQTISVLNNLLGGISGQGFVRCATAPGKPRSDCPGCGYAPSFADPATATASTFAMNMLLPTGTPLFDYAPNDGNGGRADGSLCFSTLDNCQAALEGLNWVVAPAPPPAPLPPMSPGFTRCGDPRCVCMCSMYRGAVGRRREQLCLCLL